MKYVSMILAVLLVTSILVVTVGAVQTEELNCETVDQFGHTHEFTIHLVGPEELPHHTELSPFFKETELIESDEEESEEIPETVKEWFVNTAKIIESDDITSISINTVPEDKTGI